MLRWGWGGVGGGGRSRWCRGCRGCGGLGVHGLEGSRISNGVVFRGSRLWMWEHKACVEGLVGVGIYGVCRV